MGDGALQAGADRFSGFGDLYDGVRPVPPTELGELIAAYRGGSVGSAVDLGSGTGLSTRWASGWASEVVGIEPSEDMRRTAQERHAASGITYVEGWSHQTGVPDGAADAVVAVQALHWMEPEATFREVERILRPGGVFAAVDCDWPPVVGDRTAEQAWDDCRRHIRIFEARLADGADLGAPVSAAERESVARHSPADAHQGRRLSEGVKSWSKSGHLDRMSASGRFAWCREVAMTSSTEGNADRFVGLLKSQGDYQTLRRHGLDDTTLAVDRFAALAHDRLGSEPRPWRFVYRARLGFTPP